MTQATHFIEQIKYKDGLIKVMAPFKIHLLHESLSISKKFGIETIAIFKVYPKVKSN